MHDAGFPAYRHKMPRLPTNLGRRLRLMTRRRLGDFTHARRQSRGLDYAAASRRGSPHDAISPGRVAIAASLRLWRLMPISKPLRKSVGPTAMALPLILPIRAKAPGFKCTTHDARITGRHTRYYRMP